MSTVDAVHLLLGHLLFIDIIWHQPSQAHCHPAPAGSHFTGFVL